MLTSESNADNAAANFRERLAVAADVLDESGNPICGRDVRDAVAALEVLQGIREIASSPPDDWEWLLRMIRQNASQVLAVRPGVSHVEGGVGKRRSYWNQPATRADHLTTIMFSVVSVVAAVLFLS